MNVLGKFFIPIDIEQDPPCPFGRPGGYKIGPRGDCVYKDDDGAKAASAQEYFEELKAQWPDYILEDKEDNSPLLDEDGVPSRIFEDGKLVSPPLAVRKEMLCAKSLVKLKANHRRLALEPAEGDYTTYRNDIDARFAAKEQAIKDEAAKADPDLQKLKSMGDEL